MASQHQRTEQPWMSEAHAYQLRAQISARAESSVPKQTWPLRKSALEKIFDSKTKAMEARTSDSKPTPLPCLGESARIQGLRSEVLVSKARSCMKVKMEGPRLAK